MPEFTFLLFLVNVPLRVFLHLDNESDLSGVAEVADSQEAEFPYEAISRQLHFIFALLQQVLHRHWLQLHYGTD
jgi:hypothetical protein